MGTRLLLCTLAVVLACQPTPERVSPDPSSQEPSPSLSQAPSVRPEFPPISGTCRSKHATPRPIVASRLSRIVLLDASDGDELCTLASLAARIESVLDVEVTPDGRTVYFSTGGLGHCGSIYSIEIEGGPIRGVARGGYSPSVSPDGRKLAYDASYACGDRRHRVVVRDIATGAEREWIGTREGGYGNPKWAPDPRFLIVARAGADSQQYFLLDTREIGPLDGEDWPPHEDLGTVSGVDLSSLGAFLGSATLRPGTKTVAFGVAYSDPAGTEPYPIIEYDPDERTFRTLFSGPGSPLDFDPTGLSLLYRRLDTTGRLYRYTHGRSVHLGQGFQDASW